MAGTLTRCLFLSRFRPGSLFICSSIKLLTSQEIVLVERPSDLAMAVYDSPFFNLVSITIRSSQQSCIYLLLDAFLTSLPVNWLSKNPLNHGTKIETCLY